MIKMFIAGSVLFLSGCSFMLPAADVASDKVVEGVERYCAEVDERSREEFRKMVNGKMEHAIEVVCKDD